MDRAGKIKVREAVAEKLNKANALIVAEFRGLTVEQLTKLRVELRKAKTEFRVTKNRILKKAVDGDVTKFKALSATLKGPVAAAIVFGDAAAAAKTLFEFEKDNELFKIRNGVMDGMLVNVDEMKAISSLPSKDVLVAKMLGTLLNPHRGLVTVLSGVPRQLVTVINAIKDTKKA